MAVITGTSGNDSLAGTSGDDTITGEGGNDTIDGAAGNDSIVGGAGNDEVYGGIGNDTLRTDANSADTLYGEDGADTITIAGGTAGQTNTASGGAGDDLITSSAGAGQNMSGDDGNDTITSAFGEDTIIGGAGNDSLSAGTRADIVDGGAGDDTIDGGTGDDTIDGGADSDMIDGGAGNDSISGGAGIDIIDGGSGNDTITTDVFDTSVLGGDDRDTFILDTTGAINGDTFAIDGGTGGDDVDLVDLAASGLTIVNGTFNGTQDADGDSWSGTVDVTDGADTFTLDFTEIESPLCFTHGVLIATEDGDVAVEDLRVGDRVMTLDHGPQPIRWIGSHRADRDMLEQNEKFRPVRIRAGALGGGLPVRDLVVSPQHRVLVRSKVAERMFGVQEVLVPARKLTALEGVTVEQDRDSVEYFHFLFDDHQIVVSNGMLTESLFTGPEALRAVSPEARAEILTLFPELAAPDHVARPARHIPEKGKWMAKLVARHQANGQPLCYEDFQTARAS